MFNTKDYSIFYQNSQETKKGCGEFYQSLILSRRSPQSKGQRLKILLETTGIRKEKAAKIFSPLSNTSESQEVAA